MFILKSHILLHIFVFCVIFYIDYIFVEFIYFGMFQYNCFVIMRYVLSMANTMYVVIVMGFFI